MSDNTQDKNTFVTRTKSEFVNQLVLHKSTNTIWSTGQLANSEIVLVGNVLLSHVCGNSGNSLFNSIHYIMLWQCRDL